MKKSLILIIVLFTLPTMFYAQAYVKFYDTPKMELVSQQNYTGYKVMYKALKKSTIYLELKKGNQTVAIGEYFIANPGQKVVAMPIKVLENIGDLSPANNYSYHLYMYEGRPNDWTTKACRTKTIDHVKVIAPNNYKSGGARRLIHSFN